MASDNVLAPDEMTGGGSDGNGGGVAVPSLIGDLDAIIVSLGQNEFGSGNGGSGGTGVGGGGRGAGVVSTRLGNQGGGSGANGGDGPQRGGGIVGGGGRYAYDGGAAATDDSVLTVDVDASMASMAHTAQWAVGASGSGGDGGGGGGPAMATEPANGIENVVAQGVTSSAGVSVGGDTLTPVGDGVHERYITMATNTTATPADDRTLHGSNGGRDAVADQRSRRSRKRFAPWLRRQKRQALSTQQPLDEAENSDSGKDFDTFANGLVRVYCDMLIPGLTYGLVPVDFRTTAQKVVEAFLERFAPHLDPAQYCLAHVKTRSKTLRRLSLGLLARGKNRQLSRDECPMLLGRLHKGHRLELQRTHDPTEHHQDGPVTLTPARAKRPSSIADRVLPAHLRSPPSLTSADSRPRLCFATAVEHNGYDQRHYFIRIADFSSATNAAAILPLEAGPTLFGKVPSRKIRFFEMAGQGVRKWHAATVVKDDACVLVSLGNAITLVNNLRISMPVVLQDLDIVTIGPSRFRFRLLPHCVDGSELDPTASRQLRHS